MKNQTSQKQSLHKMIQFFTKINQVRIKMMANLLNLMEKTNVKNLLETDSKSLSGKKQISKRLYQSMIP